MSWISETPESEAHGLLRDICDAIRKQRGKVARILGVHSLDPGALQHHLDLYMHLMLSPGSLSRHEREAIAVAVPAANGGLPRDAMHGGRVVCAVDSRREECGTRPARHCPLNDRMPGFVPCRIAGRP